MNNELHRHTNMTQAIKSNTTEFQMPKSIHDVNGSIWYGKQPVHFPSTPKQQIPLTESHSTEKVEDMGQNKEILKHVTFLPHMGYDVLHKLTFKGILPQVKVKEEYKDAIRIAWSKYAIFESISHLDWNIAKKKSTTRLSPYILLLFALYDVSNDFREEYEWNVGNRPHLLDYSSELPLSEVEFPVPFSFSRHRLSSLLLFGHYEDEVMFSGVFRMFIDKMLNMQEWVHNEEMNGGTWVDIDFDSTYIQYEKIPVPSLIGSYSQMDALEKQKILQMFQEREYEDERDTVGKLKSHTVYTEDFIFFDPRDKNGTFTNFETILLVDDTPTKSIFWFVKSEHSTNFSDFLDSKGKDPILKTMLYIGDELWEVISENDDRRLLYEHSKGRPLVKGMHFYTFSDGKLFSNGSTHNVQLKGLDAKLRIFVSEEKKKGFGKTGKKMKKHMDEEEEEEFMAFCILHVEKRLHYYKRENDEYIRCDVEDSSGEFIYNLQRQMKNRH